MVSLSDYFKIPIDILIKNDLSRSQDDSFIETGAYRVLFPITVDGTNEDLIEIVPVEASEGYLHGYSDPEYSELLNKIKLPFLPTETHCDFRIKGDSMLPVKSGKTYIVLTFNISKEVIDKRTITRTYTKEGDCSSW